MTTDLRCVEAVPSEAEEFSRFLSDIFRRTYAHGYPADRLERHIARYHGAPRLRAELETPTRWTLRVAERGRWRAFVTVGHAAPAPDAIDAERPAQIERLYVETEAQGTGLAQRLLDAAVERAAAEGHDALWLAVWQHNARAKRFYEKVGFMHVGTHPFEFDGVAELDDLYVRLLHTR